jgi:hypothetical protein
MTRRHPGFALTERDIRIIRYITMLRGVPIEHLEELFFEFDPYTREKNKNPARACERRLRELGRHRYVRFVREFDGDRRRQLVVVEIGAHGIGDEHAAYVKRARKRRPPARHGAHHVKTLDALHAIRRDVEQRGGRLVRVQLDNDLRAHLRQGRMTQMGDFYEPMPDAIVWIAMPGQPREEVVVEYVTSKYTDADIRRKHRAFKNYSRTIWVADKPHTAERVRALTGESCRVI